MTVYLDELMIVNFALDYLLLWGAGLLSGKTLRRWRIALGALFGSVYALVCALCEWRLVFWLPVRVLVGIAMCFLTYGKRPWRTAGCFFALGAAMAGGVYFLSVFSGGRVGYLSGAVYVRLSSLWLLALAGAVWLGLTALSRLPSLAQRHKKDRLKAEIFCGGRRVETEVFVDTGCMLRDPADNSPVIILSAELAGELLPREVCLATPEAGVLLGGEWNPRLVFATGITGGGALFAFTVSVSFEDGEKRPMTAAVSPSLGSEGISALVGKIFE